MSVSTIYSAARGEASLPPRLDRAHPLSTSLLGSQSWSTPEESHTKSGPVGPRNAGQAGLGLDVLGLIFLVSGPLSLREHLPQPSDLLCGLACSLSLRLLLGKC